VRFLQGMIEHHAQALAMTALVPSRSARADLRILAERIDVSQRDEIASMSAWLADHRHTVPESAHGGHAGHATPMPGMLTAAQLAALESARGPEFDRRFLESMIQHHEGALRMVADLMATPGAAQDPDIFRVASEVDSDQRAEIARMRQLLAAVTTP
jgi:uncharacterized protein (DUF305 family)